MNPYNELFATYKKTPAHNNKPNSIILAPYKTKADAEEARIKYGYTNDNYYVDIVLLLPAKFRFDINRKNLYEYDKPKERTRNRLIQMAEYGMEEISLANFGYKGIMSGLYIEKVWSYSDEDFKDYMDWAKCLIINELK